MSNKAKDQDDVLAFLADSKTYGGGSETVKRIDTHAASVFLTKDRVLKIKRAVKFPFLDYSTLEKRKAACKAELKVNAPYAPEIYRGVIAITREGGGKLALNGSGEPIEWAVEMRRFDENRTLDHITDQIDDTLADALGRAVADAHEKIKPVAAEPWIEAIGQYIDEHFEAFSGYPEIFPKADNETFAKASRAAYERIVPLLRERGRAGLIRHIHGDLHLGNIVLIGDRPVLFDAIEFSELIASGDVLYDLAFLADGFAGTRLGKAGQYRTEPLSGADAPQRRSRCAGGAAILSCVAGRDPRQGHRGADGAGKAVGAARHRQIGAGLFRLRAAGDQPCPTAIHRCRRLVRHR